MTYLLVLQWPASSIDDYDRLIDVENLLIDTLVSEGVDGHDMGSGEANIFIRTNFPQATFDSIRPLLAERDMLRHCRAAFREANGEDYFVLWPVGASEFSIK